MAIWRFSNRRAKLKAAKLGICAVGFTLPADSSRIAVIGSCFVISRAKNILGSCYHYINPNPPVNFPPAHLANLKALVPLRKETNGRTVHYDWKPMKLLEKDEGNDVALFEVDGLSESIAEEIHLGDSEKLNEGDFVYFIGYPYAAQIKNEGWGYTEIVNRGIVSTIKYNDKNELVFILVDAISNPGNSGCPLLLEKTNKVVGVMTNAFRKRSDIAKYNDLDIREPMHFGGARPVNALKALLNKKS